MDKILEVHDLRIYYRSIYGDYKSVDGVSLEVFRNEVFSIAGESGCGKSTLVDGMLRLVKTPGYIPSGKVIFEGTDLLKLPEKELNRIRWTKLAYVPQGAMNSLNPFLKVKEQMIDVILDHSNMKKEEARQLIMQLLQEVGLSAKVAEMYPHELSGGMKQRVIIAMAIALKPTLIIADEPTTALDVVVQKGILQLLRTLKDKYHMSVIIVSHSMAAHAQVGDRVAIMYAGKVVEVGSVYELFEDPLHPYSKGLITAVPSLERKMVKGIPGLAPSPLDWPKGCRFHPRCPFVMDVCKEIEPPIKSTQPGRLVACHLHGD
ncbi:ABC transporter ATP-binding protein [Candidatus Bathyarchaeota archaeon]|nr:ABC transporter ATP-binding protein [Candidatus Bathyarchaeota archaeon]